MQPERSCGLTACRSGRDNVVHQQYPLTFNNVAVADTERVFLIVETSLHRNTLLWPRVSPAAKNVFVSAHTKPPRQHMCNDAGRIKSATQTYLPALRNRNHHVSGITIQFLVPSGDQQIRQRRSLGS